MTPETRPLPPPAAQPPGAPDPADVYAPREPASPERRHRARLVAYALLALVAAAGVAWALLRGGEARENAVAEAPPAAAAGDGGAADVSALARYDLDGDGFVYQSGMHPEIVQDEPGTCPICGMDLTRIPVTNAPAGTVEIDPVTLQNMGVRTALVTTRELERSLRTTGTFEARDDGRETVTLRVGGFVERLYVDTEGQRVRRGQPLLEIYSPELVSTQQDLLLAARNRELLGGGGASDRLVEAARTRLRLFGLSAQQIAAVTETGAVQETVTLFAPASGTVQNKRIVEGMQAMAGMPLLDIVDLGTLYLQVAVPEQDLGWVRPGTRAVIDVSSLPGEEMLGRVDYVYDTIDAATRTGTARVTVPNTDGRLRPGMYATARLFGDASAPRPVVPSEAVVRTGAEAEGEAAVILALGEGRFRPQPVTLGEESGGLVQILSGLQAGDRVVTSAQFLIDSEARLSSALAGMSAMPGMDMSGTDAP